MISRYVQRGLLYNFHVPQIFFHRKSLLVIRNKLVKIGKYSDFILNQILSILQNYELIWMKIETAQSLQSLYGNYYEESK